MCSPVNPVPVYSPPTYLNAGPASIYTTPVIKQPQLSNVIVSTHPTHGPTTARSIVYSTPVASPPVPSIQIPQWSPIAQPTEGNFPHGYPEQTQSQCSIKRRQKDPEVYTGESDFQEYLLYFERVSKWNGWYEAEKGSQLGMTVSREARGVISNLPQDLQGNYAAMVNALTKRFNPPG